MIIVLIHWRIKPGREDEFLEFWSKQATISDNQKLIGEFLSKVEKSSAQHPFPWITWHIDPESFGDATHYVNVGIWEDENAFYSQIADKFNDDSPIKEFEQYRRRRLLLRPQKYRIGGSPLPQANSCDVV